VEPPWLAQQQQVRPCQRMRRQRGNQTLRLLARKKTRNPSKRSRPSSSRARRCSMRRPEGSGAEPRGAWRMKSPTASRGSTLGTPKARPKLAAASSSARNAPSTDPSEARPGRAGGEGYGPCPTLPACEELPERLSARAPPRSASRHEQGAVRAAAPRSGPVISIVFSFGYGIQCVLVTRDS